MENNQEALKTPVHETELCPVCGTIIYYKEGKRCADKDCPVRIPEAKETLFVITATPKKQDETTD
jgi:hypothetical protein